MRFPYRQIFLTAVFFTTVSCTSLLAPKVDATAAALQQGNYKLDSDHAALLFKIRHMGLSTFVGRFNSFDVGLQFDASDPTASRIDAIIDMTSLDVANDKFAETLKGPNWFDAGTYPQARFTSDSISITSEKGGVMHGMLTMHGITKPVNIDVIFNGGADVLLTGKYTIGFEGSGQFSRKEFGMDRFSAFVGDTVTLEIHGEFQKQ